MPSKFIDTDKAMASLRDCLNGLPPNLRKAQQNNLVDAAIQCRTGAPKTTYKDRPHLPWWPVGLKQTSTSRMSGKSQLQVIEAALFPPGFAICSEHLKKLKNLRESITTDIDAVKKCIYNISFSATTWKRQVN